MLAKKRAKRATSGASRGRSGRAQPALSKESLKEFTRILRLMSNQTRLQLLLTLARDEHSVSELCEMLEISQPSASHHLGLLRMSGLVRDRRRGKQVFYTIDRELWSDIGRRFFSTESTNPGGLSPLIGG